MTRNTDLALHEQLISLLRSFYWQQFMPQPIAGEQVEVGLPNTSGATPVGDPKEQCWQFSIKSALIKNLDREPVFRGDIGGDLSCVFLQSAAFEEGEAKFVVCCRKERGKCKDCAVGVRLIVKRGDEQLVSKFISITCKPAPD